MQWACRWLGGLLAADDGRRRCRPIVGRQSRIVEPSSGRVSLPLLRRAAAGRAKGSAQLGEGVRLEGAVEVRREEAPALDAARDGRLAQDGA